MVIFAPVVHLSLKTNWPMLSSPDFILENCSFFLPLCQLDVNKISYALPGDGKSCLKIAHIVLKNNLEILEKYSNIYVRMSSVLLREREGTGPVSS